MCRQQVIWFRQPDLLAGTYRVGLVMSKSHGCPSSIFAHVRFAESTGRLER